MKKELLLGTLALSLALGCAAAADDTPFDRTAKYEDIVWATVETTSGEEKELKMDIFQAEDVTENSPVVVFVHGGAWWDDSYKLERERSGEWTSVEINTITDLVEEGVTVATIGYRLSQEAPYPAQIYDCKGAVRYLRAHADEYGIDPERIASCGTSAGSHLALLLAVTGDVEELEGETGGNLDQSSRVMACVDFYGMTDIINLSTDLYDTPYKINAQEAYLQVDAYDSARSQLIGFNAEGQGMGVLRAEQFNPDTEYKEYLELVKMASPIYFVTTDDCPIFIGQGGKDGRVAVAQAQRFHQLLIQANIESTLMIDSQAGHGGLGKLVQNGAKEFLRDQFGLTE